MEYKELVDGVIASSLDHPQVGGDWIISKRTLRGGLQQGVELIVVNNGKVQFNVIVTRGMSVYRLQCGEVSLGWDSPVRQIVHPQFVDLSSDGGLGWLGGFNEMMVRCGAEFAGHPGEDEGRMLTLHGRVGNIPATEVAVIIDDEPPHRIRVRGRVDESMFKFGRFELWTEVSTVPGSNSIQFHDELTNLSEYKREYQMIYHANFGRPILEAGAQFVAPVQALWPLDDYAAQDLEAYQGYLGPTADFGEQVYCMELAADDEGLTSTLLHNSAESMGVHVRHQTASLPFFNLWKNTDTESDGYVTGLEPSTGFPFNRSLERKMGRVPVLAAGQSVTFQVEIVALENSQQVSAVQDTIESIQADVEPRIHSDPPVV